MSFEIIISLLAALGVGGILGALLNRYFDQQKQIVEHDIKIFNQSNKILSEKKLSEIIELDLDDDHSISDNDLELLESWCMFFEETGNQYIDKRIERATQKLLEGVFWLTNFIGFNFAKSKFQDHRGGIRNLYPHWNPDQDNVPNSDYESGYKEFTKLIPDVPLGYVAKFEECLKELQGLTREVKHLYSEYRLTVKKRLKI